MRFRGEFSLREFSWVRFTVVSLPDAARRLAAVQRLIKPYRTRVARTRPAESGRLQLGAKARSEHHRVRPVLRPTQTRRRHSCNRLAGSAAVSSPSLRHSQACAEYRACAAWDGTLRCALHVLSLSIFLPDNQSVSQSIPHSYQRSTWSTYIHTQS